MVSRREKWVGAEARVLPLALKYDVDVRSGLALDNRSTQQQTGLFNIYQALDHHDGERQARGKHVRYIDHSAIVRKSEHAQGV